MPTSLPPSGFRHLADAVLLNRAVYGGADDMASPYLSRYSAALDPDAVGNRAALNVYDGYAAYLKNFGFRTLSSSALGLAPSFAERSDGLDHDFTYRGGLFRNNFQTLPSGVEVPFTGAGAVALVTLKQEGDARVLHLTFRGTDADIGGDGEATTGPGQVRYYRQLENLIDKVYDFAAKAANGVREVVVSGHSLGGAMADLFTLYDGARFAALPDVKLSVVSLASAGVDPETLALRPDYDKSLVTKDTAGFSFKTPDWYASYDQAGDIVRNPQAYDAAAHRRAEPGQAAITGFVVSLLRDHLHFEGNRISIETPLLDQYAVSKPLATNLLPLHYASFYEMVGGELAAAAAFVGDFKAYDRVVALNGLNAESLKTPGTNDASGFGVRVDDVFAAVSARDSIVVLGLSGDDRIAAGSGSDFLFGGEGCDRLSGGRGADLLAGGLGDDTLLGDRGDDLLNGGAGNDRLFGGGGDDVLRGGRGGDLFSGGVGDDRLYGGFGRDCALFAGDWEDYRVQRSGDLVTVTDLDRSDGDDGCDVLKGVEMIRFAGGDLLLV